MVVGQKPIGVVAPNPGISTEIEGAPASMPGGNDGKDKTTMTGTPATVAVAPPPISPDLQGGPNYVAVDPTQTTSVDVKADGPTTTTDTEQEPTADAPALSPEEQAKADAVMGYDQQIETLRKAAEQYAPETPEQRKKRERREKSKRIIAAVSDGISALSNLFFTSQYAPNMYIPEKGSMMKPVNDRIEKLKAEREKKRDHILFRFLHHHILHLFLHFIIVPVQHHTDRFQLQSLFLQLLDLSEAFDIFLGVTSMSHLIASDGKRKLILPVAEHMRLHLHQF